MSIRCAALWILLFAGVCEAQTTSIPSSQLAYSTGSFLSGVPVLMYDRAANQLGLFTATPEAQIHINGYTLFSDRVQIRDSGFTTLFVGGQTVIGALGLGGFSNPPFGTLVVNDSLTVLSSTDHKNILGLRLNTGSSVAELTSDASGAGASYWPLSIKTNGVEALRVSLEPFLQLTGSYTGVSVPPSGAAGLRNNAGILQLSNNGGAWLNIATTFAFPGGVIDQLAYWKSDTELAAVGGMTDGQLVIGSTGTTPAIGNISAGIGINVTDGPGTIGIANAGVVFLSGTANEIAVSDSTGVVTLSGAGASLSLTCPGGQAIVSITTSNGIVTAASCGVP